MAPSAWAARCIRVVFLRSITEIPASGCRWWRYLRDARGNVHLDWRLPRIGPWIHRGRIEVPGAAGHPPPSHAPIVPVVDPMAAAPNYPVVFMEMRDVTMKNPRVLMLRIG